MNSSCYQCTNRHIGCHSSCGRYAEYKKEHSARKNKYIKDNMYNRSYTAYEMQLRAGK